MAKKPVPNTETSSAEVVEELHASDGGVEYTDVTGKDDLPEGVDDPAKDDDKPAVADAKLKPAKAVAAEDEIPEELKGKTPAQLAKMYRDAQSVIGRQGSELGDLRRTADQYIKAHLTDAARKAVPAKVIENKKPIDDVTFFTNPTAAVRDLVASHPALKHLEGVARESAARDMVRQRNESAKEFHAKHPDAGAVMQDAEFQAWVVKSPIRKAMILRAHQHYDLQAGDEVFSTWKEIKAARTHPTTDGKDSGKLKSKTVAGKEAARVPTGGNASPHTEAGGKTEGKIYRRADVIRLMEQDPSRYEAMADEITKAYQEGRVR